ncbi:MAG: cation transporter [Deltaproteobacteria bacterium]|nr:cation transporter [Deltaproteobacteria bacterium]
MKEQQKPRRKRRPRNRDHSDMIAICLSDGPRTVADIEEQFIAFPRSFGLFIEIFDRESIDRGDLTRDLLTDLEKMNDAGLVERQGERYELTPLGYEKAAGKLAGLREAGMLARKLAEPEIVSRVSLGVHLGLAALKLPAGLLSGSVGLINDAADTLLDGLASLLVYAGFRFNKERAVNGILVLLMLGTGVFTCHEAMKRFFIPVQPEVDWFAFLAALLSALVCLALWGYQRYVGLRRGSMALITQSVDSRNHVIVALSVTAGLIAALLRFSLLDTLVGLAVAILILKSAVELGVDTVRSLREKEADFSRYRTGLTERYAKFRRAQLRDWMLYLVKKEEGLSQAALRKRACQALDFSEIPALRELGLDRQSEAEELVEQSLTELYERGWLAGNERLNLTGEGIERLSGLLKRTRGERHRLSTGSKRG